MGIQYVYDPLLMEDGTARLQFQLYEVDATAIPLTALLTLTLTAYDALTGTVLNAREAQNVKNANNVTVSSTGLVTWLLQPNDTVVVDATCTLEEHIALFEWTWSTGQQAEEIHLFVRNLAYIGA